MPKSNRIISPEVIAAKWYNIILTDDNIHTVLRETFFPKHKERADECNDYTNARVGDQKRPRWTPEEEALLLTGGIPPRRNKRGCERHLYNLKRKKEVKK